jgi:GH25 family lysozyme M1 (1,4-beta-N-acetylmuramidase)
MLEHLITSRYLYPLWRIGWIERLFFLACRLITIRRPSAFLDRLFGFDISKYQGSVDFLKMLAYGAKFLILRCGYAITKDERFEEYIAAAYGVLPLASYHFYDPIYDPTAQAKKVIAILEPHRHKIRRVWLDFEFWWSGPYAHPKYWKIYRDAIKAAGYKVGIYTRATWWDSRVGEYATEFAKDPVWAAQYNNVLNLIPRGWSRSKVWQRGTPPIGTLAGVSSKEIDENLWNDEFNFVEEWGEAPSLPPTNGGTMPEPITHYLKLTPTVATAYRTIRAAHHPNLLGAEVGRILAGQTGKAYADPLKKVICTQDVYVKNSVGINVLRAKAGDVWLECFEANGVPLKDTSGNLITGMIAEIHLGERYLVVEEIGAPQTDPPAQELPTLRVTIEGGNLYESAVVELKPKT